MRRSLADKIEQYIKVLIDRSGEDQIVIQRSELAETFACVPSQVTYVIATRFTIEDGYITESRRGGKGFVRIMRRQETNPFQQVKTLAAFVEDLLQKELIGKKEYGMLVYLLDYTCHNLEPQQQSEILMIIGSALSSFINSQPR
ncbi:MAG TPA: CtsR family transcriptional regulator [Syntrophomonadaceae bacterium]|nr:CtsR family transcriptional regulator [Syntrophomonadaceae bacterium]